MESSTAWPIKLSKIVTTGLDPVVYADPPSILRSRMDCRVKPGNDGIYGSSQSNQAMTN